MHIFIFSAYGGEYMNHKEIAENAIKQYNINVCSMDFIAQSGSTIYKVKSASGDDYCLRLYASVNNALGEEWTSRQSINSMLQWTHALSKDKPNITIPCPVLNASNELITNIDGMLCTVENWLEGEQKPYFVTEQDAANVGILLAHLHEHASSWKIPKNFQRPSFDSNCINETLAALEKTSLDFSKDCINALKLGANKVIELLNTYERTSKTWGIIHADIIPPNLLYYENEIRPIDFGACGLGHFLWDIATTMPFVPLQYREILLNAYSTVFSLPDNYIELIEGFFIACRLQVLGFFINLPDAADWVPDEYEKLYQRELGRYLRGESFLYQGTPYYA